MSNGEEFITVFNPRRELGVIHFGELHRAISEGDESGKYELAVPVMHQGRRGFIPASQFRDAQLQGAKFDPETLTEFLRNKQVTNLGELVARHDPSVARYAAQALPYAGGILGAYVGSKAGVGPGVGAAALGAGGGEILKRWARREPITIKDIAGAEITKGALPELSGQALRGMAPFAGRLLARIPTASRRIAGSALMQRVIRRLAPSSELTSEEAVKAVAGRAEQELTERTLEFETRLRRADELRKARISEVAKPPGIPESPSDFILGRNVRDAIYRQRIRIAKAVERRDYGFIDKQANELGLEVEPTHFIATASEMLGPEELSVLVRASPLSDRTLSTLARTSKLAESKALIPKLSFGGTVEGRIYDLPTQVRKGLAEAGKIDPRYVEEEFTGIVDWQQARRVIESLNQRIARLMRARPEENAQELRALKLTKDALEDDMGQALKGHPELRTLYDQAKAVSRERFAYRRQPEIRRALAKEAPTAPERIPAKLLQPGAVTVPSQFAEGLKPGPAVEAALTGRYAPDLRLQALRASSERLASQVKGDLGRRAVAKVIGSGTKAGRFDAQASLDFLEARPQLQSQMGEAALQSLKRELTSRAQSEATAKAAADISELEQGIKTELAKFRSSEMFRTLRTISGSDNPRTLFRLLRQNPNMADRVAQLIPDESSRGALARGLVDDTVRRSGEPTLTGVTAKFNAVQFAQNYAAIRPSLVKLVRPESLTSMDNLANTLTEISQKITFKTGGQFAVYERVGIGAYIRGVSRDTMEVLTGRAQEEMAIRPVHIMKISRDPRLIDLLSEGARTSKTSPRGRYISFALAYALSGFEDDEKEYPGQSE